MAAKVSVGEFDWLAVGSEWITRAKPKSRILIVLGREHHVARLQIAMDDAFLVRRFERVEHLPGIGDGFVKRHRAPLQPRGQRLAVDELENQVARLAGVGDFEPVDRADVRVAQCGEDLRFAFEPGDAFGSFATRSGRALMATWRFSRGSRAL